MNSQNYQVISPPTIEWRQFWIVHPFVFSFLFTMSRTHRVKVRDNAFFPALTFRWQSSTRPRGNLYLPRVDRCSARRGTRCLRKRNWNLQMRTTCSRNEKDDYKSASLFVFERVNRGDETRTRSIDTRASTLVYYYSRSNASLLVR